MEHDALVPGCFSCDQQRAGSLPPRDDLVHTSHWRVAHAFNSTLPGAGSFLLPIRHVTCFTDLTPEAADELGGVIRRLGVALEAVTGCVKTYLMQFSEARASLTFTFIWCQDCLTNQKKSATQGLCLSHRRSSQVAHAG